MINYKERIEGLYKRLNSCCLCPHHCGVNRFISSSGKCRSGNKIFVASHTLHFGEEPPISGYAGSGTIFFSNCTLSCVFCQNYPISQLGNGNLVKVSELSSIMLELQQRGAHNINFVTPSHMAAHIVEAVFEAKEKGLTIPLVYNCSGYEEIETLKLLDGIIDIYMPDAKYSDNTISKKYSSAEDYWEINKLALKEMYRQVGNLIINKNGIAEKGLLIRHLILPDNISGSNIILEFIAKELSKQTFISIMAQYHPAHKTSQYPELSRRISLEEYNKVLKVVDFLGLENGWQQEL